jgi:hypothetical protein
LTPIDLRRLQNLLDSKSAIGLALGFPFLFSLVSLVSFLHSKCRPPLLAKARSLELLGFLDREPLVPRTGHFSWGIL